MGLLDDKHGSRQPQPDDELWDDFLNEMDVEEPAEKTPAASAEKGKARRRAKREKRPPKQGKESPTPQTPKKSRARAKGKGLSLPQLLILALLGILIVVAYLALARVFRQTLPGVSPTGEATTEVSEGTLPLNVPPTTIPPTPTLKRVQVNTPIPLPTATPALPIVTKYDEQIVLHPDDVDMRLQRGAEYLRLGAYEAALADFEHARSIDDQRAETHVGLGQTNYLLLNWPEAENAFLTAIALDPASSLSHFDLGMLYYLQGRYQEAAIEFDKAAEISPDYAEAEAWLAIASAQFGDADEATAAAERAINITEDSAIVHIARSWAYRIQNPPDVDAAQSDLLYAQKLEPYNFELLIELARFYSDYRPERLAEAEQLAYYASNWAKGDLERARALYTLGHVYLAQGRKSEARKVLAEAADLTTYQGQVLLFGVVADLERALEP
ncbi:MAG TPA: tetratricopeptide repeat protein [Anaerolineae bacterium]|nr:tetratricopeptide repeat protein [Anaerolineae bacterium]HQH39942.1 tetratricopeptide repeat protein [Anaerolineae bacterium]